MQTRSTLRREYLSELTCQSTGTCSCPSCKLLQGPRPTACSRERPSYNLLRGFLAGDDPSELAVGDEAPLLRPRPLDRIEDCGEPVIGDVESELGDLDADRVEAALLAEHDAALGSDELGRVRLDRRWVVELGGNRARLAREEVVARDGLPGRARRAA